MPKSIETSEIDLSHETATDAHERELSLGKKYRHQNYSKNIYIGTKNAEKWELTRTKLAFKNDVEFVSYLLTLADNDFLNNEGRNHNGGSGSFPIQLEQNLNEKLHSDAASRVSENSEKPTKKVKKVQFHDSVNGLSTGSKSTRDHFATLRKAEQQPNNFSVLSQNSQDAQDNSITSTIESYCANTVPEVLDCRIAEKIKSELEQKLGVENGLAKIKSDPQVAEEALCLATNKDKYGGAFEAINNRTAAKKEPAAAKPKRKQRSRDTSLEEKIITARVCNDFDLKKKISLKIKTTKPDIRKAPSDPNLIQPLPQQSQPHQSPPSQQQQQQQLQSQQQQQQQRSDDDQFDDNEFENNKSDFLDSDKEDDDEYDSEDNDSGGGGDDEEDDEEEEEEMEEIIPEEADTDASKIKLCSYCSEDHTPEQCPIRSATSDIVDNIALEKWQEKYGKDIEKPIKKEEDDEEQEESEDGSYLNECPQKLSMSYAEMSVPAQFELRQSSAQLLSIFTKEPIRKYTRFGPLVAPTVLEVDIPDDCTMQSLIEIYDGEKSTFFSVENKDDSNWIQYLRPATTRDSRNIVLVAMDKQAYFVTCSDIAEGCELLYWSDDCNSAWGRKKIEKMNCGGCNLKFEHPLYYRTHCSVFHDPAFSLTIRKYHCKICGSAILGKENIMKHAAQMHDGKGAYQCQFCKKFFLRLNYLEMHRTYGCSANPQRARPLCDFCGRKFCQPQKLKVHIKRMHSDMADVLRDFQCKLCSKLLGSRAALQRHSKEVHSRNSAVVSCPRCQKLFQNRSNLKIHMLTHSGVRPFKCIEGECNAAFTTKQCLQFHYKKVHSYAQEQMPKIERSVAYTFDAYSGGMKVEYLAPTLSEQAPRRRRKSLEDQSAIINSVIQNNNRSDTEYSDNENIFENFKRSGKSISNICKNEPNLSLLSSKITSILEQGIKHRKREKKSKKSFISESALPTQPHLQQQLQHQQLVDMPPRRNSLVSEQSSDMPIDNKNQDDFLQSFQQKRQQNKQLSLIESFLSTAAPRSTPNDQEMEQNLDIDNNSYKTQDSDGKIRDLSINAVPHVIPSKGSRKWLGTENSNSRDEDNDVTNKLTQPNRDFLSRLMMNGAQNEDDDENSSFLDVVDTNNGATSVHHSIPSQYSNSLSGPTSNLPQLPHLSTMPHLHSQPFMGSFYGNNVNGSNRNGSTSASMLVEAALSSVGGMMNEDDSMAKNGHNENNDNMNNSMEVDMGSMHHNQHSDPPPSHDSRFSSNINSLNAIENEIKMIKNLNNFPLQIAPLPHFANSTSSMNHTPTHNSPINDNNMPQDNDIDVDTASTPRTVEPPEKMYTDNDNFGNQHQQTPPTPHVLSPGRDYAMYNSSNNISSPLSQISRRNYPEHELISPASSPALPRYGFRLDMCRKRDHDDQIHNNMSSMDGRNSQQHNMSSDDENSIMAQNLSMGSHNNSSEEMRMKFNPPQMDLMYSKYENNGGGTDMSEMRSKYLDQGMDVPSFRGNADSMNDMQGLDMTARPNLSGGFHHNFQLPSASNNIGRYHHHIYDILSEREQQQEQLQHQHMQHLLQDQMSTDQEQDQTTSVDLSRSASYTVASPPPLPYSHSHSDMLRMASLDLAPNSSGGMVVGGNRSFLSPQLQHSTRDGLDHHRFLSSADQHRLLSANNVGSDQIGGNHRLLVDPATHLLMEQNSRLLSSEQPRLLADSTSNRHMVSPRGFGAYHQVSSANYHHSVRPLASPNHHSVNPSNYHPFPSYYQ